MTRHEEKCDVEQKRAEDERWRDADEREDENNELHVEFI
jgi:hypothetical protein